jgi:hypothetical protein
LPNPCSAQGRGFLCDYLRLRKGGLERDLPLNIYFAKDSLKNYGKDAMGNSPSEVLPERETLINPSIHLQANFS